MKIDNKAFYEAFEPLYREFELQVNRLADTGSSDNILELGGRVYIEPADSKAPTSRPLKSVQPD